MPPFSLADIAAGLPAAELIPQLTKLSRDCTNVVVAAPPGTGKTTVVPPVLANLHSDRIVVTQPKRLAARAAAARLAALDGSEVGDRIGYSVRGEQRRSRTTRIEFVTDGLLVRRLLADPDLAGVSCVVLDEIHERSLDGDLAAAMLREVSELRDDFQLVAMSATADESRWQAFFDATVIRVDAALHPITEDWRPMSGHRLDERGCRPEFLEHLASVTRHAHRQAQSLCAGARVLTFVPGAREAERVSDRLNELGLRAAPLHGSLALPQQQRVLSDSSGIEAIVATNIAESSLTVPGVRAVVDSGLARQARVDAQRGLPELVTVPASRAAAAQRAGRAGREGEGLVWRCYDHTTWGAMPEHPLPEVATGDVAPVALSLAVWHGSACDFSLLPERPPAQSASAALDQLESLGALHDDALTELGRTLSRVPAHPRLAKALVVGSELIGSELAADLVAVLASGERAPGSDLLALTQSLRRGDHPASYRYRADRERFAAAVADTTGAESEQHPVSLERALALIVATAYPDFVARRRPDSFDPQRGAEYLLVSGAGVRCTNPSLSASEWLAISEVQRTASGNLVRAAVPLENDAARSITQPMTRETTTHAWSGERVRAMRMVSVGAITISSTAIATSPEIVTAAVRERIETEGVAWLNWSPAAETLRRRMALARATFGDPWPDVSDAALAERLDDWFGLELDEIARGATIRDIDLVEPLRRLLPWPEASRFDELIPERLTVPSGSAIRLDYPPIDRLDESPVLAVKLQECFGLQATPTIAQGRIRVLCHLLSPAGRAVAVTADLASFWAGPYAEVRAQLRGRYPKHPWPEDPLQATPTRHTTARLRNGD